mmetsp:Transcript_7107/g.23363  ORF Transcript_7107/g.23363 Transcript_7107/m.23363 type:complete len:354 (-) Transcript_7107:664-1725(-)
MVNQLLSLKYRTGRLLRHLTGNISLEIDTLKALTHVFDDEYWKRRCDELSCGVCLHQWGLTWKQCFAEHFICQVSAQTGTVVSRFVLLLCLNGDSTSGTQSLLGVKDFQDYIFSFSFKALGLSAVKLNSLCSMLPNLTRVELSGVQSGLPTEYALKHFSLKLADARSVASALSNPQCLATLIIQSSSINDDLLRVLMNGLVTNGGVTHLDLSHNEITDHGVRLICSLLGEHGVLAYLALADNLIQREGGRYLGKALCANQSLVALNLRLNRLKDAGGEHLLDGLLEKSSLTAINLAANFLGSVTALTLSRILLGDSSHLRELDLSSNELSNRDMEVLQEAARSSLVTSGSQDL